MRDLTTQTMHRVIGSVWVLVAIAVAVALVVLPLSCLSSAKEFDVVEFFRRIFGR